MKEPLVERVTVRKLLRPMAGFRYAATPHVRMGMGEWEVPFGEYLGVTEEEARAKAAKAATAWKELL